MLKGTAAARACYRFFLNGMLVIEYEGRKIPISYSHVQPNVTPLCELLGRTRPMGIAAQWISPLASRVPSW